MPKKGKSAISKFPQIRGTLISREIWDLFSTFQTKYGKISIIPYSVNKYDGAVALSSKNGFLLKAIHLWVWFHSMICVHNLATNVTWTKSSVNVVRIFSLVWYVMFSVSIIGTSWTISFQPAVVSTILNCILHLDRQFSGKSFFFLGDQIVTEFMCHIHIIYTYEKKIVFIQKSVSRIYH